MGARFFIDETKAKGYVVVAVRCPEEALVHARRTVGNLVLPGQRSVHMKHERDRRRRSVADAVARLAGAGLTAVVFDAGRGPDSQLARRARALRAIVELAAVERRASLVLDLDRTLVPFDRRVLIELVRQFGPGAISYNHSALASEPLLALPDVVAWCWARGGDWRRRIGPIVSGVVQI